MNGKWPRFYYGLNFPSTCFQKDNADTTNHLTEALIVVRINWWHNKEVNIAEERFLIERHLSVFRLAILDLESLLFLFTLFC